MEEPLNWQAIKDYRSDTAGEEASLASFKRDLEFTMAAAQAILARAKDSSQPETGAPENTLIVTSLWNSALVSYARCFASGVRARLDVSEFKLWPGIVADAETAHSYFINQRNKYIAHSVNRFEESRVALMVSHSQRGVIGGGPFLLWPSAESEENVSILLNLATFLKAQVEGRMPETIERMLTEARALSFEELSALPEMAIQLPIEPSEAGIPRRR